MRELRSLCGSCNKQVKIHEELYEMGNGAIHIYGTCPDCGKYIMFVPFKASALVKQILGDVIKSDKYPTRRSLSTKQLLQTGRVQL